MRLRLSIPLALWLLVLTIDAGSSSHHDEESSPSLTALGSDESLPLLAADATHKEDEENEGMDMGMETPIPHVMEHAHGRPILETPLKPLEKQWWDAYNTTTYFTVESNNKVNLYLHIGTLCFSFILLYPIVLVLNNLHHKAYLPTLTIHCVLVVFSVLNYASFIKSIPDLYPGNAYDKMSWILFFTTLLHWVASVIAVGYQSRLSPDRFVIGDDDDDVVDYDYDDDVVTRVESGSSSNPNDDLHRSSTNSSNSFELTNMHLKTSQNSLLTNQQPHQPPKKFLFLFNIPIIKKLIDVSGNASVLSASIFNWYHFFYFLVYFPTMIATFLLLGKGKSVFNLLAHFIKGGVFFSLGLLYLARYCGAFTNKGWAWNHKFIFRHQKLGRFDRSWQSIGCWTMELIESGLVLFYGCTNIFLEHLSNSGGEWSSKDLQHASIAFIFIGLGFCGVLTEIKLNTWRFDKAKDNHQIINNSPSEDSIVKASPGFSPNPFPVLTIYWTGYLMSKHQQASALSTAIHVQWGGLFVIACAFRFLTYLLMLLSPPNKNLTQPSRPITELIASFCLICGGLIFMESTDPVIYCFEYYGLTEMFTLNISLGFVALLVAWEMAVFAYKDWLKSRI